MELQKRKSIRVKDYGYSQNGAYFVTICTHNRECILEKTANIIHTLKHELRIMNHEIRITAPEPHPR